MTLKRRKKNLERKSSYLPGHICSIPEDVGGLPRLAPNASCGKHLLRSLRKFISLNVNLSITRRWRLYNNVKSVHKLYRCRNFRNMSQANAEAKRHAGSKYFYTIHPYSNMQCLRELLFLFTALWDIIMIPVFASFNWVFRQRPEMLKHVYWKNAV